MGGLSWFREQGMHGGVVEWLKATGCKPVDLRVYAGSNPAPSKKRQVLAQRLEIIDNKYFKARAGVTQLVE